MAVGDIKGTVITEFKADIKDMVKKLGGIVKAQNKQTKVAKESADIQTKAIGKIRTGFTEFKSAIDLVSGAYGKLRESMDVYVQDARLKHASAGASIEGLRKASKGLINDTDLMTLAAAGLNNGFGTTQKQLEAVAGFMAQLQHEGNKSEMVINDLTKALAEGGVEELTKFGVTLRDASGALIGKGEPGFNALVEEAARKSKELGAAAGDDAARGIVTWDNAMKDLNATLGKAGGLIAPIISDIAKLGTNIADLAQQMKGNNSFFGLLGANVSMSKRIAAETLAIYVEIAKIQAEIAGLEGNRNRFAQPKRPAQSAAERKAWEDRYKARLRVIYKGDVAGLEAAFAEAGFGSPGAGAGAGRGGGAGGLSAANLERQLLEFMFLNPAVGNQGFGVEGRGPLDFQPEVDIGTGRPGGGFFGPAQGDAGLGGMAGAKEGLTDFQQIALTLVPALGALQSASNQAFTAIVTGSMSAGAALKRMAGDAILGMATSLFATSISEGIQALVSLAIFDGRGAAMHGKAAGAAAAGAVALGAMARAMGVGGAAPGAGAATGGFRGGSAGGGSHQVQHKTIFYGDSFGDLSPRRRAARVKRDLNDPGEGVSFN